MTDERRYDEDEVRRIFAEAAEEPGRVASRPGRSHDLTLTELQAIGEEVGLRRDAVARAATALDRPAPAEGRRTLMGVPYGVGHSVALPRNPTDEEWGRMVADLRETFRAPGSVESAGTLRRWHNGNLNVYVEPGPDGPRMRMETVKGSARELAAGGGVLLAMALVMGIFLLVSGEAGRELMGPVIMGLLGGGMLGTAALPLPTWAGTREEQMEALGARWTRALEAPPDDEG